MSEMPPFYPKLRQGQKDLVDLLLANPNQALTTARMPGGYGKTIAAYAAYATKRKAGVVNRLLMVVVNLTQVNQILREAREDLVFLGIDILTDAKGIPVYHYRNDGQSVLHSTNNNFEIYVTTIQSLDVGVKNGTIFNLLRSAKTKWMLFLDEMHHMAHDASWGNTVKDLFGELQFMLAVSATPERHDFRQVFGKDGMDINLSFDRARDEGGVLKQFEVRPLDFDIKSLQAEGEIEYKASDLGTAASVLGPERERKEQAKLRKFWDFINPLLNKAFEDTVMRSARMNIRGKVLVRVRRQWLAEEIAKMVDGRFGLSAGWIGCDNPDSDANQKVIKRFLMETDDLNTGETKLDGLIQVGMAGEGFNCKRIINLVDLTAPLNEDAIGTKQLVLRGSRWIPGIAAEHQLCKIWVPSDHFLARQHSIIGWLDGAAIEENEEGETKKRENANGEEDFTIDPYGPFFAQPIEVEEHEVLRVLANLHAPSPVPPNVLEGVRRAMYEVKKQDAELFNRRAQEENAKSLTHAYINKCVGKRRGEMGLGKEDGGFDLHVKHARNEFNKLIRGLFKEIRWIEEGFNRAQRDWQAYFQENKRPAWLTFKK